MIKSVLVQSLLGFLYENESSPQRSFSVSSHPPAHYHNKDMAAGEEIIKKHVVFLLTSR